MNSSNSNCGGKRMISNLKLHKHKFTCDVDKDFDTINWSPIDFGVQEEPYRGWYKLNTNEESYPAKRGESLNGKIVRAEVERSPAIGKIQRGRPLKGQKKTNGIQVQNQTV
tara:strand:+ start:431 stop:763 length:333 start_codon:yes stop_codon:yes gene_type:complete